MSTSWQLRHFGGALEPVVEPPVDLPDQGVRLRVLASGVCHTDVHTWEGSYDLGGGRKLDLSARVRLPLTLGHEIAGTVVACGDSADRRWLGRRAVVYPWIGCGACEACAAGRDPFCAKPRYLGIDAHGGFAEHVNVPHERYLVPIDRLQPGQAAPLACSGLTAWSALGKVAPLGPREPLLLIGAGGVGLAAMGQARARVQAPVTVADLYDDKLDAARALGAVHTVRTDDHAAALQALQQAAPTGFAAVIDFVGSPQTFELAWSVLRKGGTLVVVGLFGGEARFPLPMLPARSLTVRGSYVGSLQEMHALVAAAESGAVALPPLTPRPLAQAHACLCDLRAGRGIGRFVLLPGQEGEAR